MSDKYVLATDDNGDLAVRTVTAEESPTANSTDIITATTDGKLAVRVVGASGGGSSYTAGTGIDITSGVISVTSPTLQNTATPTNSLSILGTNTTSDNTITIGKNCNVYGTQGNSVVIGNSISVNYVPEGVGIGNKCTPYNYSVCVGKESGGAGTYSVSLGWKAKSNATHAIQIGNTGSSTTNNDANTMKVANANGNFEMMSADGTIPTARLTKVNTTITLTAVGWSSNTQTVSVTGVTVDGVVMVSPDPTDQSAYTSAGILCTAQAAGSLSFSCDTVPSGDLSVNIVML